MGNPDGTIVLQGESLSFSDAQALANAGDIAEDECIVLQSKNSCCQCYLPRAANINNHGKGGATRGRGANGYWKWTKGNDNGKGGGYGYGYGYR
jgi:hypothetical protein